MDKVDPWEQIILILAIPVVAMVVLPVLLPSLRDWIVGQLLTYQVVVPASDALFEVPTTGVGLDLPRILIGVGVLAIGVSMIGGTARRRAQER